MYPNLGLVRFLWSITYNDLFILLLEYDILVSQENLCALTRSLHVSANVLLQMILYHV